MRRLHLSAQTLAALQHRREDEGNCGKKALGGITPSEIETFMSAARKVEDKQPKTFHFLNKNVGYCNK